MSFSGIFKKASNLILGFQNESCVPQYISEGEVIFCKNNVCVHPPAVLRQDTDIIHHPGYLTLTSQLSAVTNSPTLVLTWIPNTSLRHNPSSVEQRSLSASRYGEMRRQSSESCESRRHSSASTESHHSLPNCDWLRAVENRLKYDSTTSISSSDTSLKTPDDNTDSNKLTEKNVTTSCNFNACNNEDSCNFVPNIVINSSQPSSTVVDDDKDVENKLLDGTILRFQNNCSKEKSHTQSNDNELRRSLSEKSEVAPTWMISPELLALRHNLHFPESNTASPVFRRAQRVCRKFVVDLGEMRSLRLFFSDPASTQGQLVVASRQCQYKILHFHHGGLNKLAAMLQTWNQLTLRGSGDMPYRHFMVCRPAVKEGDLHPEEGSVPEITPSDWANILNPIGQIEDDITLRKGIFLGGLSPSLRKTVWPFLLHCYSFQSTTAEREQIQEIRRHEYQQITARREGLEDAAKERFHRKIQCVVEKDVVRTDRSNPYFAGDSNPHVQTMMNILLNYAIYNASLGYTQGMSDLLAPLLVEIETEADVFWCFVGLMQRGMFICTPTDSDMECNLNYLRELIREMVPEFYAHLQKHADAMELLFCHRWILLCFKREFPEPMVLRIWEACWSNYLTDFFHLFICVAIVSAYADDVIAQNLRPDEMLLHFSSLAMFMDGDLILRKARGLLYQFREKPVIPCTLVGLCQLCGPGIWDSSHAPTVQCRGDPHLCPRHPCPYRGIVHPS